MLEEERSKLNRLKQSLKFAEAPCQVPMNKIIYDSDPNEAKASSERIDYVWEDLPEEVQLEARNFHDMTTW